MLQTMLLGIEILFVFPKENLMLYKPFLYVNILTQK